MSATLFDVAYANVTPEGDIAVHLASTADETETTVVLEDGTANGLLTEIARALKTSGYLRA